MRISDHSETYSKTHNNSGLPVDPYDLNLEFFALKKWPEPLMTGEGTLNTTEITLSNCYCPQGN